MKIKELEDKIKEIFGADTGVEFHPQHNWCLKIRTKKEYLFSEQMDKLASLQKEYGLDIHTSIDGILFKRLNLYITKIENHVKKG